MNKEIVYIKDKLYNKYKRRKEVTITCDDCYFNTRAVCFTEEGYKHCKAGLYYFTPAQAIEILLEELTL
jgi:hypothetical protein